MAENFNKSIVAKGNSSKRHLSFGVCSVGVSSAYLKCKILKWTELTTNDLVQENYVAGMV